MSPPTDKILVARRVIDDAKRLMERLGDHFITCSEIDGHVGEVGFCGRVYRELAAALSPPPAGEAMLFSLEDDSA